MPLVVTVSDVASVPFTVPLTAYELYEDDSLFMALFVEGGSGGAASFEITGGADADLFYLAGPASLAFTSQDFETPYDADGDNVYEVEITARNGEDAGVATYTVTVLDDNDGSYFFSPDAWTIAENAAAVGTVVADDLRSSDPIAYAISGGADGASFEIDAATGQFGFLAAPDFEAAGDTDGDNVYELEVAATWNGTTVFQTLTVTVSGANEAPVITSNGGGASADLVVSENATAVTTVAAADPEGGVSYAISGGADAALFAIDAASGELAFLAVPDSEAPGDADADNVYEVIVSASDGSLTDSQALSIAIGDVGEAPVIVSNGGGEGAAIALGENGTAVTTVAASDPEGGVDYSIAGGADAARFAIDAATGALSFVAAPDFEAPADADADNLYEVVVRASDGTLSDTQALSVTAGDGRHIRIFRRLAASCGRCALNGPWTRT